MTEAFFREPAWQVPAVVTTAVEVARLTPFPRGAPAEGVSPLPVAILAPRPEPNPAAEQVADTARGATSMERDVNPAAQDEPVPGATFLQVAAVDTAAVVTAAAGAFLVALA